MKKIIFTFIILSLLSCKNEVKKVIVKKVIDKNSSEFPTVKNLSEFPNTVFVPTLENIISKDKNAIYTSTTLFAWDEIRKILSKINIDPEFTSLSLLNNSTSYQNSLKKEEIKTKIKIEENKIYSSAYFQKSLPFPFDLERMKSPLTFENTQVENFGFQGDYFEYPNKSYQVFQIVYYNNDNDFIFKMFVRDSNHEIIICKSDSFNDKTLSSILIQIEEKIKIGEKKKYEDQNSWKYNYNPELDEVKIPILEFNIESNYVELTNKKFISNNKEFVTKVMYQRNAFVFNERGAKIESDAILEAAAAAKEEIIKPKPKHLILNKKFIVIAKRTDSKNPYFMAFIQNSELMKIFKK